jgi:hypothetical protein
MDSEDEQDISWAKNAKGQGMGYALRYLFDKNWFAEVVNGRPFEQQIFPEPNVDASSVGISTGQLAHIMAAFARSNNQIPVHLGRILDTLANSNENFHFAPDKVASWLTDNQPNSRKYAAGSPFPTSAGIIRSDMELLWRFVFPGIFLFLQKRNSRNAMIEFA